MRIPPEITTFFISMVPIIDIRFGIPIGIHMGLSPFIAFFWGTLGNITATYIGMRLFQPITNFMMNHSKLSKKILNKIFESTRDKHEASVTKYGPIFIMLFVAVPLPGSGGLVGALIGFLFGISFWRNFAYTTAGILTAGTMVALGVKSIEAIFHILI